MPAIVLALENGQDKGLADTVHRTGEHKLFCVKGALEKLLPKCTRMATGAGEAHMQAASAEYCMHQLASQGRWCWRSPRESGTRITTSSLTTWGLCLLGLVAMIDPLRPEAADAVNRCRAAGTKVCVLTGNHPHTAMTIAR